ncbi:MAG: Fe-S cluster assembly protein SufD [Tissierellia bacterium]|nr:Fe-S cluster assembly protein SufD [Tissierellia bacterium]
MITWKRIRLDNFLFPKIYDYKKEFIRLEEELPLGIRLDKIYDTIDRTKINWLSTNEINGLGKEFISFVNEFYNSGISLYLQKDIKINKPLVIEFNMDKENPTVIDKNIIVAEPNSEATIIFHYSTDDDIEAFHNGFTEIHAKENSTITIIKVQRVNSLSHNFDTNIAYVKGEGKVNWISVELGSHISGSDYTTFLEEEASESNLSSIYLGDGNRKMDLSYSMIHKGPRSISNIETRGALMDNSKKVFRGNLDFKKGARLSKGAEEEYVLLLDPTVKSDSIPALLCEEDDVQGEHAASAGQISESQLFYLMSRGLSEREAKKLIIEGAFRPIIDRIPLEGLKQIIDSEIERRLMNA